MVLGSNVKNMCRQDTISHQPAFREEDHQGLAAGHPPGDSAKAGIMLPQYNVTLHPCSTYQTRHPYVASFPPSLPEMAEKKLTNT
jgi:hypothetical protein